MQGLIDSIFRKYPIPPIFLHQIRDTGLDDHETIRYEIVDGQQRIRALAAYPGGKFPLLDAAVDKRLRLPNSLRKLPAPGGKQKFSDLDNALRTELDTKQIDVFVISELVDADEVRDLFIRLQSGTALTRQQIRDAWPGTIGPFIVGLAGKIDSTPSIKLFKQIDRRGGGTRSEDESDQYGTDRQFCAQLLCIFLARESDPLSEQSIGANDLDELYHDYTTFDVNGETPKRFLEILNITSSVFLVAFAKTIGDGKKRVKLKFRKLDVIAVFMLIQDLSRNKQFKFDNTFPQKLASHILETRETTATGKSTSGPAIATYYFGWRSRLPEELGVRLDPIRVFSDEQKAQMLQRDGPTCQMCKKALTLADAEGDHHPTPWRAGGRTLIENGRLVHKACHIRGRPAAAADLIDLAELGF